ncbi:uncharacterized protein LOC101854225 [Aplysia californica]|uniref:Uncharacterized protein LOC101854225 n=1 Tax=Aplysia californica TaxID=6500 RepID=A0ABM0JCU2_APLCA|nr:uncharacterized protein LOC101854225 [Aplysia californica]
MSNRKQIDCLIESDDEDLSLGRDWAKVEENVKNNGFRMGLEASQEDKPDAQCGFNSGFREALQMALAAGKLDGEICARLTLPGLNQASSTESTAAEQKTAEGDRKREQVTGSSAAMSLQNILTANSVLIEEIPAFLSPTFHEKIASFGSVKENFGSLKDDSSHIVSEKEVKSCDSDGNSQSHRTDVKDSSVCEAVCSSQSPFWNQLESFKAQAHSIDFDLPT